MQIKFNEIISLIFWFLANATGRDIWKELLLVRQRRVHAPGQKRDEVRQSASVYRLTFPFASSSDIPLRFDFIAASAKTCSFYAPAGLWSWTVSWPFSCFSGRFSSSGGLACFFYYFYTLSIPGLEKYAPKLNYIYVPMIVRLFKQVQYTRAGPKYLSPPFQNEGVPVNFGFDVCFL